MNPCTIWPCLHVAIAAYSYLNLIFPVEVGGEVHKTLTDVLSDADE